MISISKTPQNFYAVGFLTLVSLRGKMVEGKKMEFVIFYCIFPFTIISNGI